MHYIYFLLLSMFLFIFQACEYESDISIPSYLEINKITLEHENAIGITDAWVFVNGNIQGVYELPAKFPILNVGETEIKIYPGIKVNGIAATRSYYPFYSPYDIKLDLESGETTKISPRIGYESWANVQIVDDFERSEPKFIAGSTSDTVLVRTTNSFSGTYAGAIYLDTVNTLFNASSELSFEIPNFSGNESGIFLEMNFKGDVYLEVGIFDGKGVPVIYLQPTDEWKKIYIDLYNYLLWNGEGQRFLLFLRAQMGADMEEATILIDDMKIVTAKEL